MKPLIIVSICLLILFSCKDEYYYPVPRAHYPKFELSDTLVYKCVQTGELDSLVVNRYEVRCTGDGNECLERLEIDLIYIKNRELTAKAITLFITHSGSNNVFRYEGHFSVDEQYGIGYYYDYSKGDYNDIEIETIVVNGVKYREVMIKEYDESEFLANKIYKLWFNYDYGIIKYKLGDDTTIELLKKPF
jgi:hypothetical protein